MEHDYSVVVQNILGIVFNRNDGTVVEAVLEKPLELLVRFGVQTRKIGFSKGTGSSLVEFGGGFLPRRRLIEDDELALPQ